jgi:hypothetical protein
VKVVTRSDGYTIYRKRNQRYGVRNKDKQWVRGDDKVAILLAHNLLQAAVPQAPDQPEEPPAETAESGAPTAESGGEDAADAAAGKDQP